MIKTTVFTSNSKVEINSEMEFYVFKCGSGDTIYGENAKLIKVLNKNLVFETESGSIVKTEIGTINTVGKAEKNNYVVSFGIINNKENARISRVQYWNDKKGVIEFK